LRFALDRVLESERARYIDVDRIVAAGHSYGASTTLLATGATVERHGRSIGLQDERIKAAIVISAPPFYGELDTGSILRHVKVDSVEIGTVGQDLAIRRKR
jgi:hypothetical protein